MTCRPAGAPMTPLNVTLWTAQSKQQQGTTRGGKQLHRLCSVAPTIMVTALPASSGRQVVMWSHHVWRLSSEFIPLCILQVMLQCHAALVIF
ncbi:hypothetical protein PCASD_26805 [Puccinia coronata f. sp. avenae]|uniref:Uncharacterized protein n=1 Tax=Puccinia coronata f. sp. avenae TaxID=200324 RepID=A0A2N5RV35_9BASI|nr:hypothetical protein PCASD_26805 [Puccinia coronata f. sp. avenae]